MSVTEWIAKRRELLDAATEGEWVVGDRDHIQGASHCTCRPEYGPLVWEGRRDINGVQMMAHIHRAQEPRYDDTSIYSTSLPYPGIVALSTSEYGPIQPGNATLIADARTSLPRALDALEAVLVEHRPKDFGLLDVRCQTCFTGSAGYAVPAPYPCSPVRAIETALRGES